MAVGLVVAQPHFLGECELQDYECGLLAHAVVRVDHALFEGEEVVGVHTGQSLERDEHVVRLEADGQFLASEAAGESQQRLQHQPQLGQLQLLAAAHQVQQGEVVVLGEDLALLHLDAESLLQLRAHLHQRHHERLLLPQPLVDSPEEAVPRLPDHVRAPECHHEAPLLGAEEVHLPEAGVLEAFEEGEGGRGVLAVAHLNATILISNQQLFEAVLELEDLSVEVRALLEDDACCHHRSLDPAGAAECGLALDEAVGDVALLALRGQRHDDLQRVAVGSQDDRLDLALGDGLEQLVGALAHLAQRQQLLDQLQDLLGELVVGDGFGLEDALLGLLFLLLLGLPEDVDELLLLLLHLFQLSTTEPRSIISHDQHQPLRLARQGHRHRPARLRAVVPPVAAGVLLRRVRAAGAAGARAAAARGRQQQRHPAAQGQAHRQRQAQGGAANMRTAQEELRPQLPAHHRNARKTPRRQPARRTAARHQPQRTRDLLQDLPQAAPRRAGGLRPQAVLRDPEAGRALLLRDDPQAHPAGDTVGLGGGGDADGQAEERAVAGHEPEGDRQGGQQFEVRALGLPGQEGGSGAAGGVGGGEPQADEGGVAAGLPAGRDDRRRAQERREGQGLRAQGRGSARDREGPPQEEQEENVLHHLPRTAHHRHHRHPHHHHAGQKGQRQHH